MPPKVYVETSVIGAYFEERKDIVSASQRYWSRLWWDEIRSEYDVVVSEGVIAELADPDFKYSQSALSLVDRVPQAEINNEVQDIVDIYITENTHATGALRRCFTLSTCFISQMRLFADMELQTFSESK